VVALGMITAMRIGLVSAATTIDGAGIQAATSNVTNTAAKNKRFMLIKSSISFLIA
jgi:hypothetical protein